MQLKGKTYLLIYENTAFSQHLVRWLNQQGAEIIAVGENTKQLTRLMYAKQLHDFIYCDIDNPTSLLNMLNYLNQMHSVNQLRLVAESAARIEKISSKAELSGKLLPEYLIAAMPLHDSKDSVTLTPLSTIAFPAEQDAACYHKSSGHQQQHP